MKKKKKKREMIVLYQPALLDCGEGRKVREGEGRRERTTRNASAWNRRPLHFTPSLSILLMRAKVKML